MIHTQGTSVRITLGGEQIPGIVVLFTSHVPGTIPHFYMNEYLLPLISAHFHDTLTIADLSGHCWTARILKLEKDICLFTNFTAVSIAEAQTIRLPKPVLA